MAGWTVRFERRAERDLGHLSSQNRDRVIRFLEDRVLSLPSPRSVGEALNGRLSGLWKYRVGDIRIIADIRDTELLVLVIEVGNRREIYR